MYSTYLPYYVLLKDGTILTKTLTEDLHLNQNLPVQFGAGLSQFPLSLHRRSLCLLPVTNPLSHSYTAVLLNTVEPLGKLNIPLDIFLGIPQSKKNRQELISY